MPLCKIGKVEVPPVNYFTTGKEVGDRCPDESMIYDEADCLAAAKEQLSDTITTVKVLSGWSHMSGCYGRGTRIFLGETAGKEGTDGSWTGLCKRTGTSSETISMDATVGDVEDCDAGANAMATSCEDALGAEEGSVKGEATSCETDRRRLNNRANIKLTYKTDNLKAADRAMQKASDPKFAEKLRQNMKRKDALKNSSLESITPPSRKSSLKRCVGSEECEGRKVGVCEDLSGCSLETVDVNCEEGEGDKCKKCFDIVKRTGPNQCKECNEGFNKIGRTCTSGYVLSNAGEGCAPEACILTAEECEAAIKEINQKKTRFKFDILDEKRQFRFSPGCNFDADNCDPEDPDTTGCFRFRYNARLKATVKGNTREICHG